MAAWCTQRSAGDWRRDMGGGSGCGRASVRRARELRSRPTGAERKLWAHLRKRQLAGVRVRRQHPIGPYVVDFYCAKARLVIELDGPVHRTHGGQADLARQAYLKSRGLLVVRFDNDQVLCQLEETLYRLRSMIWPRLDAHGQ